jgi:hypothetical protein
MVYPLALGDQGVARDSALRCVNRDRWHTTAEKLPCIPALDHPQ